MKQSLLTFFISLTCISAFAQNVGIGTATPLDKLHVIGNIRSSTLAGVGNRMVLSDPNGTLINATGITSPAWMILGNTGTVATTNFIGTTDAVDFIVKTGGAAAANERMRFFSTGPISVNCLTTQAGDMLGVYAAGYPGAISGTNGWAINGYSNTLNAASIYGENASGFGTYGNGAVGALGISANATGFGMQAVNANASGTGLIATGNNLAGTYLLAGSAGSFKASRFGVLAFSAVNASTTSGAAVLGLNNKTTIISFNGGAGVTGIDSAFGSGVIGASYANGGEGIYGTGLSTNGTGVLGVATTGTFAYGVWGVVPATATLANNSVGVMGDNQFSGTSSIGVLGQELAAPNGATRYAVFANGDLAASGVKTFVIDHPLDPANKYLKHFSIESNEVLNMYRGNVVLDASGEAVVQMPQYFNAINNSNISYNLTGIGQQASLYIKEELTGNQFRIAGGQPGMKVSWMLTAERNDPYMQQNPQLRETEVNKPADAAGKYLLPYLYGQPADAAIYRSGSKRAIPVTAESKQAPAVITKEKK
jgi:hypothetical protein